jgi:endogenous inhibitor of DNA gyrase (YacG/DUF329 family)
MMVTPARACPICGKPASEKARPFCGARCAQIDLGRWLTESYRVPVRDDEASDTDDGEVVVPHPGDPQAG